MEKGALKVSFFAFPLLVISLKIGHVHSHGRLNDPPGRSTLWRFHEFQKYDPPVNYDDNELYCGGVAVQHNQNGGKCGICGDPWNQPTPRENEGGGKYGRGIIVRNYPEGSIINVAVNLTTSHKGHMEFRVCPHNSPHTPANQTCLDKYLLEQADGSGPKVIVKDAERYHWTLYQLKFRLPSGLQCSQCVFQWNYITGNTWHPCDDGINFDCGPQETFRGCADISISRKPSVSRPSGRKLL